MEKNIIVDSHVHIGISEGTELSYTFDTFLEFMDKYGIGYSVAIPSVSKITSSKDSNDAFLRGYKALSDSSRFFPLLLADPSDLRTLRQIKEEDICGMKYHPSIMETTIDDEKLVPFLEYCNDQEMIVLVHCGRSLFSDISHIINISGKYKKINFIAAHLGGNATDIIEKVLATLKNGCPSNLYLDTSAGKLPRLIEKAGEIIGYDKIIFGSDEPYVDFRIEKMCVDLLEITDENKDLIFSKNILRLLK